MNMHTYMYMYRMLHEVGPMSFLVEQAGGKASTGSKRILVRHIYDYYKVMQCIDIHIYVYLCMLNMMFLYMYGGWESIYWKQKNSSDTNMSIYLHICNPTHIILYACIHIYI
jgi:hypothetical protein